MESTNSDDFDFQNSPFATMTHAEVQEQMVANVAARAKAAGDASFAEAFSRPVMKTAPQGFGSIEDAETEGWIFDPRLGRWRAPAHLLNSLREQERIAKQLTDERVDSLSMADLRDVLECLTGKQGLDSHDAEALRKSVKVQAAVVAQKGRLARKNDLSEPNALNSVGGFVCRACGKHPAVGKPLLQCSRCNGASYCNATCQRAHWPQHKALCKLHAKLHKSLGEQGTDKSKFQDVMSWYAAVPDLAEGVLCLAWEERKESPMIRVQGGVNARLAHTECVPRRDWGRLKGDPLNLALRYDAPDFDPDVHYILAISAGHPGTEDWPCPTPRMKFPRPPDEMDAFVAASKRRREQESQDHHRRESTRANPWVMLVGLKAAELNGKTGIRGKWDAAKQRYAVQLKEGRTVNVRAENLVLAGLTPEGEHGFKPGVPGMRPPSPPQPPPPRPSRSTVPLSTGPWHSRDALDLVDQALGYAYQREYNGVPSADEERRFIEKRISLGMASGQGEGMLAHLDEALAKFRKVVRAATDARTGATVIARSEVETMTRSLVMALLVFFVPEGMPGTGKKWGAHLQAWVRTTGLLG